MPIPTVAGARDGAEHDLARRRRALGELSLALDAVTEVMRAAILRCFTESGLRDPELATVLVRRSNARDLSTLVGAVFTAFRPHAHEQQDELRALLRRVVTLDRRHDAMIADHVSGRDHVGEGPMRFVRRRRAPTELEAVHDLGDEANSVEMALASWCRSLSAPDRPDRARSEAAIVSATEMPPVPAADSLERSAPGEPATPTVARRFLDAWNEGAPASILATFAEGGAYVDSTLERELSGAVIASHVHRLIKDQPGLRFSWVRALRVGDAMWACHWIMHGQVTGHGHGAALGGEFEVPVCVFLRIGDDRIRSAHVVFDPEPRSEAGEIVSGASQITPGAPDGLRALKEKLDTLLEVERVFVDSRMTLASLADRLGIAPVHLSRVIHGAYGESLAALLTRFRLDEAVRLLASPEAEQASLEEIASSLGFKSRASFHSAFKRRTGRTPGEFRVDASAGGDTRGR